MSSSSKEKKPGFLKRFFSSKSTSTSDDGDVSGEGQGHSNKQGHQGHHSDKRVPAYHHSTSLYEKAQADKLQLSPQPPLKNPPPDDSHKEAKSPPSPVDITAAIGIASTSPKPAQTARNHSNEPSPSTLTSPEICFDADNETENGSKSAKSVSVPARATSAGSNKTCQLDQTSIEQCQQTRPSSKSKESACKRNGKSAAKSLSSKHSRKPSRKRQQKKTLSLSIDTNKPLEYPCTPEHIMAYHKHKPFLSRMEESLIIELNEYECLVDSRDIIGIIAKQTKLFELEPQDLWEEFFAYVDDIPSYDEVINFDVWQEFRDAKYPY